MEEITTFMAPEVGLVVEEVLVDEVEVVAMLFPPAVVDVVAVEVWVLVTALVRVPLVAVGAQVYELEEPATVAEPEAEEESTEEEGSTEDEVSVLCATTASSWEAERARIAVKKRISVCLADS
jgi:hypothetical protein